MLDELDQKEKENEGEGEGKKLAESLT